MFAHYPVVWVIIWLVIRSSGADDVTQDVSGSSTTTSNYEDASDVRQTVSSIAEEPDIDVTEASNSITRHEEVFNTEASADNATQLTAKTLSTAVGLLDQDDLTTDPLPAPTESTSTGTASTCGRTFKLVFSFIITGALCVFGLVGNTLSIIVMWPERGSNTTAFALIFLAFVDNLLICSRFLMRSVPGLCAYLGQCSSFMQTWKAELKVVGWPVVSSLQMMTAYATVIVTMIRYLAVCSPHHFKTLASMRRVRLAAALSTVFSLVLNSFRLLENKVDYVDGVKIAVATDIKTNHFFYIIHSVILNYTFGYVVPLVALAAMTYHLLKQLKIMQQNRHLMTSKSLNKVEVTTTLIAVVIVFIICQVFPLVRRTLEATLALNYQKCPYFQFYFNELTNTAIVFNSSINFVLYCVFGHRFRRHFVRLITCRRNQVEPSSLTDKTRTSDQTLPATPLPPPPASQEPLPQPEPQSPPQPASQAQPQPVESIID